MVHTSILNIQALRSEQTMTTQIADIPISTLPIRLGQFLKLAEMVQDGLEAKIRIKNGEVQVNGHIEIRRGKQLSDGDLVSMGRAICRVRLSEEPE
jgi:ribosome-associated protein